MVRNERHLRYTLLHQMNVICYVFLSSTNINGFKSYDGCVRDVCVCVCVLVVDYILRTQMLRNKNNHACS